MIRGEMRRLLIEARKTGKRVRITCKDGVQGECTVLRIHEEDFSLDPSPELVKAYDWEGCGTNVCIDYDDLAAVEFVE